MNVSKVQRLSNILMLYWVGDLLINDLPFRKSSLVFVDQNEGEKHIVAFTCFYKVRIDVTKSPSREALLPICAIRTRDYKCRNYPNSERRGECNSLSRSNIWKSERYRSPWNGSGNLRRFASGHILIDEVKSALDDRERAAYLGDRNC